MSLRARSVLRAAVLALLVVPVLAGTAGEGASVLSAAPAPSLAGEPAAPGWAQGKVDARHPFSDPVYYPLRQYMRMDCYRGNPGCPGYHQEWTMTLSVAAERGPGQEAVMAMGAGVLRFVRKGPECGRGGTRASFGTTVEVDHGGGWVSRYGHLSNRDLARYRAKHGRLVAAGERIGTMGMTGARNCGKPYLNFQVERGGRLVQVTTLTACLDSVRQQWPRAQFPSKATWNAVREDDSWPSSTPWGNRSFFPRMTAGETPANLDPADAPDGTCLPTTAPATPNRPARPAVGRAGQGRLKVVWRGQPARTVAVVRVTFLRRSDNTWQLAVARTVPAGRSAVTLTGLRSRVRHRVTVSYRNAAGWSAYSPVAERVVS